MCIESPCSIKHKTNLLNTSATQEARSPWDPRKPPQRAKRRLTEADGQGLSRDNNLHGLPTIRLPSYSVESCPHTIDKAQNIRYTKHIYM